MAKKNPTSRKKKANVRRPFDKQAAWKTITSNLVSNVVEPQTEKAHVSLVIKAYGALSSLEKGVMNHEGYYTLNLMNAFTFCLVTTLAEQGTDTLKRLMDDHVALTHQAADALFSVSERERRLSRYGASGQELSDIRAMVEALDTLAQTAPLGVLIKSIRKAHLLVDGYIKHSRPQRVA